MVLEEGGAGFGKAAAAVVGDEGLKIGAPADVVVGDGQLSGLSRQPGPYPAGGGFDHGGIEGFVTDFGHGLLQERVHGTKFGGVLFGRCHATPP